MVQEKELVRIKQNHACVLMYAHLSDDVGIVKRTYKLHRVDIEMCEVFWQKANRSFKLDVRHVEGVS